MSEQASDAAEVQLNRLLNLISEAAVEALGVSAATVTVRYGKDVSTVGATDQRLLDVDEAQYEDGGPCIAMLDRADPTFLGDVETDGDQAWEHFAETAALLGVKSSHSIHIPTDATALAATLNLYSRSPLELSDAWTRHANIYAEQVAATLQSADAYKSTATLATNLAEAMRSRAVIEQAKGILMAHEHITDDEASSASPPSPNRRTSSCATSPAVSWRRAAGRGRERANGATRAPGNPAQGNRLTKPRAAVLDTPLLLLDADTHSYKHPARVAERVKRRSRRRHAPRHGILSISGTRSSDNRFEPIGVMS